MRMLEKFHLSLMDRCHIWEHKYLRDTYKKARQKRAFLLPASCTCVNLKNMKTSLIKFGLKETKPRLAILEIIEKEDSPIDVSHIIDHVQKSDRSIDPATIYRTLETFNDKGIIKRLEFGEGKFRYELNSEDHHHLICENCGRVEDIKDDVMQKWEKEILKTKGFSVKRHNLEFFGLCRNCQN